LRKGWRDPEWRICMLACAKHGWMEILKRLHMNTILKVHTCWCQSCTGCTGLWQERL